MVILTTRLQLEESSSYSKHLERLSRDAVGCAYLEIPMTMLYLSDTGPSPHCQLLNQSSSHYFYSNQSHSSKFLDQQRVAIMTPTKTRQWIVAKKPTGTPTWTGPNATFRQETNDLPQLRDGQVLLKVLYISNDPAQRTWINPNTPDDRKYAPPVNEGDVMASGSISEVIESKFKDLEVGALVSSSTGWTEYAVVSGDKCMRIEASKDMPATLFMSLFGGAGLTAYYGLIDIVQTKSSDAVVISGAAGAVGSVAIQIAKDIIGCKKVIGIAGSDEKCEFVKTLGADVCLNYKKESFKEDLIKATDGFVEVFFDNVGGEILDLMLTRIKKDGRIAACGAISGYNDEKTAGIKNWFEIVAMRITIRGFIVTDAVNSGRSKEIVKELTKAYKNGNIKATEEGQTVVPTKFEDIPKTWMMLFSGKNTGKLITKLSYSSN